MVEHPIRPPHELVQQWVSLACENEGYETWQDLATQAARWGADHELEACSQWIHGWYGNGSREVVGNLYAARRPKPPSLKEQALDQLRSIEIDLTRCGMGIGVETIRRALESLPD